MNCVLYVKTENDNGVYYVPVEKNVLFGSLNWNIVKAMQIILDNCFTIGDYANLKNMVEKIEEKKSAYRFLTYYLEYNDFGNDKSQPNKNDFYRAGNVLEELYRFALDLDNYPLSIFAINFEQNLGQKIIRHKIGVPCTTIAG